MHNLFTRCFLELRTTANRNKFLWIIKPKTPSYGTWLGRTSEEVFVVSLFCCCSHFRSSFVDFLHSHFVFWHYPSPFRGLSPGFYKNFILSAQPIAEWFTALSFSTIPLSSYRERYGFEWMFFTHRRFLPYAPLPTVLTQPAFIGVSLGAGSSSLKFPGLHTDPRNTDPAHLFVWITVIHNLHIQNDSFLNSTIY